MPFLEMPLQTGCRCTRWDPGWVLSWAWEHAASGIRLCALQARSSQALALAALQYLRTCSGVVRAAQRFGGPWP